MDEDHVVRPLGRGSVLEDDPLLTVLRKGGQRMLMQAIEAEVAAFLALHGGQVDEAGRRRVVRNGHGPERSIQTLDRAAIKRTDQRSSPEGAGSRRVDRQADPVHLGGTARLSAADPECRGTAPLALPQG